jgi:hypothetical protein
MAYSNDFEVLSTRVTKLEKENRRLRTGFAVAGLFLVGVVTLGQSRAKNTADAVEAQRFVLRSANGEVRAELSTLDGDFPRLSLRSPNGEKEVDLNPLGISVMDHHGQPEKLPLAHFGNTGIYFTDARGRKVMELGGAGTSSPQLEPLPEIVIFNERGQAIWRAP